MQNEYIIHTQQPRVQYYNMRGNNYVCQRCYPIYFDIEEYFRSRNFAVNIAIIKNLFEKIRVNNQFRPWEI